MTFVVPLLKNTLRHSSYVASFGVLMTLTNPYAQELEFNRVIAPFPVGMVDEKGRTINFEFPFLGGLNAPRPQFVDIDQDSDLDLFLQERTDEVMFFENVGSPSQSEFRWISDQFLDLEIGTWFKFLDMDGDGDADLFTESPFSLIRYYRNDSRLGERQFTVLADTLLDAAGNVIFFDFNSTPDLADIDCDDDFDLFIGRQSGTISHYENLGLNANGAPRFQFVTDEFENIVIIGESQARSSALRSQRASNHGSNSLTFADYDTDGDPDLFWGDFFEPSIVFLENTGACPKADISITTRRFPQPVPLLSAGFNAPRFADIDADNDFDLFVGILGGAFLSGPSSGANFYHYENVGAPDQPLFSLVETQFLSNLDIGLFSLAALLDINADGDLDLFLSNEEDPSESRQSHLYFFENHGSSSSPIFTLEDDDFLGFDLGLNLAPAFVDIDNDGDLDLFLGEWDGSLDFMRNSGSAQAHQFNSVEENFAEIDVGNNCVPAFVDLDDDDDFDLVMGERLGKIIYYRNDGTPSSPEFIVDTTIFSGINVGLYSTPTFGDLDRDGDFDLLIGSDTAGLFFCENVGTKEEPDFTTELSVLDLNVDNRSAPVLADLDLDGDLDLVSGGRSGGLIYFENRDLVTSVAPREPEGLLPASIRLLQNFPNPFNPTTTIRYYVRLSQAELGQFHSLSIFNLLGQKIRQWKILGTETEFRHAIVWRGLDESGSRVPSGVYFYQLEVNSQVRLTRKMLLVQ